MYEVKKREIFLYFYTHKRNDKITSFAVDHV